MRPLVVGGETTDIGDGVGVAQFGGAEEVVVRLG